MVCVSGLQYKRGWNLKETHGWKMHSEWLLDQSSEVDDG